MYKTHTVMVTDVLETISSYIPSHQIPRRVQFNKANYSFNILHPTLLFAIKNRRALCAHNDELYKELQKGERERWQEMRSHSMEGTEGTAKGPRFNPQYLGMSRA